MKVKILGSGGCVSTPKPCCNCPICVQAREKGFPYARTGCSLFIEDARILIDTPEDINYALNNAKIDDVKYILYSHSDLDHTMGMRVIEQLRMDWLGLSVGRKNNNPIEVAALPMVLEDIKKQGTRFGSAMGYYMSRGLVIANEKRCLKANDITVELIPVDSTEHVTIFVISENERKIIYAPCDVKPFPHSELFYDADILIIGNTIVGDILKDNFVLEKNNPLREELFVMEEIFEIKEKYGIRKVIITHLEEDWGKSFDDYREIEKGYNDLAFAYDGMEIKV